RRKIPQGPGDNASVRRPVRERARRFGALENRQGRRLVFITFSGEELGLYGSIYYCNHPVFPLEDTAAMFNLDMVGRMSKDKDTDKDKLLTEGTGTSKNFDELVERLNKKYDFKLSKDVNLLPNSDHY